MFYSFIMGRSHRALVPFRDETRKIPHIAPSNRRRVCFYEYGTELDPQTGEIQSYFVDIISGSGDLVDYVGFRFYPSMETHNIYCRTPVVLSDGSPAHRFILKRSDVANWSKKMTILVCGRGGSRRVRHLNCIRRNFRARSSRLYEPRDIRRAYNEAPNLNFGVEMEMSLHRSTSAEDVVNRIQLDAGLPVIDMTNNYPQGRQTMDCWKLVPDSSIVCSRNNPDCNKFELVSPILNGEKGLQECNKVLDAVRRVGTISLHKSMGLHVHVSVESLSFHHVQNICLNFIKYEAEIDTFMPPSRRDDANKFCKSNRNVVCPNQGNGIKHSAITGTRNAYELCDLINPADDEYYKLALPRYYKLNLQNLKTGRQPTIEFRQHSCTGNFKKLEAWIRFCTRLVANSAQRPKSLKSGDDPFELLFDTVIQDIKLKLIYHQRKLELLVRDRIDDRNDETACCDACNDGRICETHQSATNIRHRRRVR